MEGSGNLIVLLQSGAATQDFRQPELADCRLHVANLPLRGSWSFDPLGGFSSNTTYHVGVGEGLGCSLSRLDAEGGRNWLGDPRVQRRRSAGHDQVAIVLVARSGTSLAVPRPRADEGGVVVQRGWHNCEFPARSTVSKLRKLVGAVKILAIFRILTMRATMRATI